MKLCRIMDYCYGKNPLNFDVEDWQPFKILVLVEASTSKCQ